MAESRKSGVFAFDEFRLDVGRLMLYRNDAELSVPPKVAKVLAVLVESAGTIISKDEVIERVWDDSIVEESNLTQYLYLLRKALGNRPDGRPYIETLRRRGYRFNGQVERIVEEKPEPGPVGRPQLQSEAAAAFGGVEREGNVLRVVDWKPAEVAAPEVTEPSPRPSIETAAPIPTSKSWLLRLAIAGALLIVIGGGGYFLWPKLMPAATIAESQAELSVSRLTNGYFPFSATISPDGNLFIYHELEGETSRMFAQQTGQASRIEITSSASQFYSSKTFTPDGQSIYYIATDKKSRLSSVYRIPTMGGGSVKVLDDVLGAVSLSPDAKEMTFVRRSKVNGDTSLLIAGADGRAERLLLQRSNPKVLLPAPGWSPDGKLIAYGERDLYDGRSTPTNRINLLNIATGKSTQLSSENWDMVFRIVWAFDGRGIFTLGTRDGDSYSTRRDQTYFTSYPEGVSHRLTNEGNRNEPDSIGVTRKGEVLTVSSNRSCQIWVMDSDGNATSAVQLTKGVADGRSGIGLLPDGRFAYLTRSAEEIPIMLSSADGASTKQIATGFQFLEELRADPQGRFVVFSAQKDGKNRVFRIDVDGANLKQLTFGEGASIDSSLSPDGKYLAYDSVTEGNDAQTYTVMRIPAEGGEPVALTKGCFIPTYSPDGSMISCISTVNPEFVVISATDGAEIERHPLPLSATWNFGVGWTTDGSGLVYINYEKGISNLWIQPRDRSKARPLTNFTSGIIYRYAISRDGSKIYLARGYPVQDAILIKNFR